MSESSERRFSRLSAHKPAVLTERDWESSVLLEPRPASEHTEFVSDGAGPPFSPLAAAGPAPPLDPEDPIVAALVVQLTRPAASGSRFSLRRKKTPDVPAVAPSLEGWRLLARGDDDALFGRGRSPRLATVAFQRDARRDKWTCVAGAAIRPLRAMRDGVRASGWRPDPSYEPSPDDGVLRVLVTEQTWAGGQRADDRLLTPDLHFGTEQLILTMFVTPLQGYQIRSANPETPARVVLPDALGTRRLIDGALYDRRADGTQLGQVDVDGT